MVRNIPQFLIAAPASGSGKTTISRGLMALLVKKGLKVQPFKCGPDYIDTKYHSAVCGRPSVNLDSFMASRKHVGELYARYSSDADACIVEGMMGMYDGYDRDKGSSAEIARWLHLPVVLVVDAKSAAYSIAPLLAGFLGFCPEIRIAGVVFNRVGSLRHYEMLQQVCADLNVTCFGYFPKEKTLEQESRYLGLDFSKSKTTDSVEQLAELLEKTVNWQLLLKITSLPLTEIEPLKLEERGKLQIMVARNEESFSFIYEEHLDILRRLGTVIFFDPESDKLGLQRADLIYLPGGYPENRSAELGKASKVKEFIHNYVEMGGRVLAECGGMIYLSQGIYLEGTDKELECNKPDKLAGVFPFYISNKKDARKLTLGYRQFDYNGQHLRGHEFHYTQFNCTNLPTSVAQVYNATGKSVNTPVFRYKNVIASYTHLYWGEVDILKLFEEC